MWLIQLSFLFLNSLRPRLVGKHGGAWPLVTKEEKSRLCALSSIPFHSIVLVSIAFHCQSTLCNFWHTIMTELDHLQPTLRLRLAPSGSMTEHGRTCSTA